MRWILVALIGMTTGAIAFLIDLGIYYLRQIKYDQFFRGKNETKKCNIVYSFFKLIVYNLTKGSGMVFLCLLVIAGFNVMYSIVAAVLVAIEVS